MPKVDDEVLNKKFIKKSYRPWNLLDDLIEPSASHRSTDVINNHSDNPLHEQNITQSNDGLTTKNIGQIKDKSETNVRQTQDKSETNIGQTWDKKTETQDKPRSQPRTDSRTNIGQTWDNLANSYSYLSLVGLQQKITFLIYEACTASRNKVTDPIPIEYIATACKTTKLSAYKTIQRLENKKIIYRSQFKVGRGGWTQYGLHESVFQEILHQETQDKLRTNLGQTWDKPRSQPRTEPRTSSPSSSGSNNIDITTTGVEQKISMDWQFVDLEPLNEIGFTQTHLRQIAQQEKLTIEMVQDSIHAFAFDLDKNNKQALLKNSPLNYFMGILRKGMPYAPPGNYESPTDEAMRLYVESKKEQEKKRQSLLNEALEFSFQEWLSGISDELKNQIIPPEIRKLQSEQPKRAVLKQYFENNLWSKKYQEIIEANN